MIKDKRMAVCRQMAAFGDGIGAVAEPDLLAAPLNLAMAQDCPLMAPTVTAILIARCEPFSFGPDRTVDDAQHIARAINH